MRRIYLTIIAIFVCTFLQAQFYKSFLPSPEFTKALEDIVLDFRINFESIKGDSISKEGNVHVYESAVKLPGALECIISYYNSRMDTTASWQAVMYRGDDFKEASKAYQNLYRLIKKTHVRWIDRSSIGFSGEMQSPTEEIRFAVSTLKFNLDDRRYKKFEAEVELINNYNNWEVRVNMHTRKADEDRY
jgi:hypothetical protein